MSNNLIVPQVSAVDSKLIVNTTKPAKDDIIYHADDVAITSL
jgi:hypothetical protein